MVKNLVEVGKKKRFHMVVIGVRLGTTSVIPTMLRLFSPLGESDGRFVHVLDFLCSNQKFI